MSILASIGVTAEMDVFLKPSPHLLCRAPVSEGRPVASNNGSYQRGQSLLAIAAIAPASSMEKRGEADMISTINASLMDISFHVLRSTQTKNVEANGS